MFHFLWLYFTKKFIQFIFEFTVNIMGVVALLGCKSSLSLDKVISSIFLVASASTWASQSISVLSTLAEVCAYWGLALSCCLSLGKYLLTSLSKLGLFGGLLIFNFLYLGTCIFPCINKSFLNYLVDFTHFPFNPSFFLY